MTRTPIIRETVGDTIERLQWEINGYESRWHMTTSRMIQRVRSGDLHETAEIAEWLITSQYLEDCHRSRQPVGSMTGTHTTNISISTTPLRQGDNSVVMYEDKYDRLLERVYWGPWPDNAWLGITWFCLVGLWAGFFAQVAVIPFRLKGMKRPRP